MKSGVAARAIPALWGCNPAPGVARLRLKQQQLKKRRFYSTAKRLRICSSAEHAMGLDERCFE